MCLYKHLCLVPLPSAHATHWQLKTKHGGDVYTVEMGKLYQQTVDPQTKFSLGLLVFSLCLLSIVPSHSFTLATYLPLPFYSQV